MSAAMPVRPYWKGYLKLSLVSCPVVLYPASSLSERTHFHQINKRTKHRLRQQMVDEETGEVVERDDKGRGYEIGKGKYVEIEENELKAVRLESTHTIDIDSFVPRSEIDDRYRDKPYYLAPDGKTSVDAFAVIREAMKEKDRVALARIVLSNREHVMSLEPLGKGLLGTTLRYPYEVRDEDAYFSGIPSPRLSRDMVQIAEHILKTKETHFDPKRFKDEYEAALQALVKRKAAGRTIEEPEEPPERGKVVSLMDALKRSLAEGGRAAPAKSRRTARARKKRAA
jgi:DNA end-binding protein Ku